MKKSGNIWLKLILTGTALMIIYKILNNYDGLKELISALVNAVFPCLLGVALALFLYIPTQKTENFLKSKTGGFVKKHAGVISVLTVYLLISALFVAGLFYVVPVLYDSIGELVANIPQYTETADNFLKSTVFLSDISISETLNKSVTGYFSAERMGEYFGIINNITSSLASVLLGVAISVYILIDREEIKEYFKIITGKLWGNRFEKETEYLKKIIALFCSYFAGQGLGALIVGVITATGLILLGVSYPVLIGVIIAVGNFIPVFGCIVSTVAAGVLIFVTQGLLEFVTMLLFVITVHTLDAYFIQPKIAGKTTGIKPIAALVSVVVFGNFFGVAGMFLGVPLTAAIKIFIDDFIQEKRAV